MKYLNRAAQAAIALIAIGTIAVLGTPPSFAEGIVLPQPQYCSTGGFWAMDPGSAISAELASQQQNAGQCSDGSRVGVFTKPLKTQWFSGGTGWDRCRVGDHNAVTADGDVTYVEVWQTNCPDVQAQFGPYGDTGRYIAAAPMQNSACPTGAQQWADGQCHCNWSYKADGANTCIPYGITVSSAPILDACHKPEKGDPIYPLTGAIEEQIDLQLGVHFAGVLRYNTSAAMARDLNTEPTQEMGNDAATMPWDVIGGYWFTALDKKLIISPRPISNGPLNILIYSGAGEYTAFTQNSQGAFTSADRLSALVAVAGGFRYYNYRDNSIEAYDAAGNLQAVFAASGASWSVNYSNSSTDQLVAPGPGYMVSLSDSFGRALNVTYKKLPSGAVRLATISGPTESVALAYYPNETLNSLSWMQANTAQAFDYDPATTWALKNIQDESGALWLRYEVDASGRVTSQSFGNGAGTYRVSYLDASGAQTAPKASASDMDNVAAGRLDRKFVWNVPTTVQINEPNGQVSTWSPTIVANYPVPAVSAQPAGAGCTDSSSSVSYNNAGDITARDDFNGNRSCFAYESGRGLPTTVLEGRANIQACSFVPSTADVTHPERLTTTTWHPDWALKVREAQPKRITTWVYNGQPDPIAGGTAACAPASALLPDGKPIAVVCARYEQATTDATGVQGFAATVTGATRAWTFMYNQFGQVLQETTPKLSAADTMSHTTTYVYYPDTSMSGGAGHTMGDLASVTNPLQQTTNFTSYDGAGRLLSSNDANGLVTTQTYWPRGWLKSQTVTPSGSAAPQLTTYDYWPTGLLKTVTMPDATTLNYAYDGAHRLTDITDSAGNKLHYVLDNDGNRTSEQVTDASGNLASTVTRVFDALNRVQSQTGLAH